MRTRRHSFYYYVSHFLVIFTQKDGGEKWWCAISSYENSKIKRNFSTHATLRFVYLKLMYNVMSEILYLDLFVCFVLITLIMPQ